MNLLGLSGSLRAASFNTALLREAAEIAGADAFELGDLNLPLYDGDVEAAGMPASVETLIAQVRAADAVIIATPEYNKMLSGVLKNALDWLSRVKPMPLAGKPTAIMSAAAGRGGGEVAQFTLRHALAAHAPRLVAGPAVAIGGAHDAFAEGTLKDEMARKLVGDLMGALRAEVGAVARARAA
ncbi:MAG: NADPH-dependent FMN reductase [Rubrimonas sp.]|uniref:NADPH-dependent FMN reductase n=1 Tax=Rubrimonas sp. TaxID=2036015 RepID=UPI002FDE55EC